MDTMVSSQMPVFLTEPPELSPTPRQPKKRTKRRKNHVSSENRDSPKSMELSLIPRKTYRGGMEKTPRGRDTARSSDDHMKPAMLADVRAGLQKAYLDGIEFMRTKVTETEQELVGIKLGFYQCDEPETDKFELYLKQCNDQFLKANNELRRKNIKLVVVDSEMSLVSLLNKLRESLDYDQGELQFISEFWENIKNTLESLKVLVNKFKSSVLDRLRGNCISYNSADVQLEVSIRYTKEISDYLTDFEQLVTNTEILMKSFDSGVHQDLFTHTQFTEGILVSCDLKAFPLLRLFPDLTEKIEFLCAIAFKWLDRDERYMFEINDYIRETRTMAKKREGILKTQKEKRKRIEKSVKAANILLQNNKYKLIKLETDLTHLESTCNVYKREKHRKHDEKSQKESMVDFLKITLTQTKKNYNLQIKRQRLLKQVKSLEEFLMGIERDLTDVEDKIHEKAQEKELLSGKVENSEKSYEVLKSDLDKFSDNLESLEQEVNGLSGQLLQLEIIQTFKSSPESMDDMYDRPQSVKLAPSLQEKIKKKRKAPASVH